LSHCETSFLELVNASTIQWLNVLMSTLFQWVHVGAAVIGVGGMGFLIVVLLPSLRVLSAEQRDLLAQAVMGRFRWVSWTAIVLLLVSGLYNVKAVWEVPWGSYWRLLTVKVFLALLVFAISLALTLPFKFLDRFRARRRLWLTLAFSLALIVILISAHLRRA
jgi:uncharacterized membrane protein